MSKYSAQLTEYEVIDDVVMERQWRGTITTGEVTFSFVLKHDGFIEGHTHDCRILLYTPDGRRVYWSKGKDAENIKTTVVAATRKAEALYRPVYLANDEPETCLISINQDSVAYEDKYGKTVYPRREDGSVAV